MRAEAGGPTTPRPVRTGRRGSTRGPAAAAWPLDRRRLRAAALTALATAAVALAGCGGGAASPRAWPAATGSQVAPDLWQEVGFRLAAFVERERDAKGIPAMSVALVDGDRIVWARGFGYEDLTDSTDAGPRTVYRVGSVSKLFTDMAIMQLVEDGRVDLDAPVSTYLPDFRPRSPFGGPGPTLRQLMTHRSGLVREPPVGNYFDDTAPTLAATVRSLNDTELVYEPESRIKYSNAAIATVGYTLETLTGKPFARALEEAVLDPLGMDDSAFEPRPEIVDRLADAVMWTWDGRRFPAPGFEMGMAPAGSMYSTVVDLGAFMSMLFRKGETPTGVRILDETSLEEMWRPQFAPAGTTSGFGLGFALGELEGRRMVRHGGAIYGFATELAALPDEGLGVVVTATLDGANTVTSRVARTALGWMLDARAGRQLRSPPGRTSPVPRALADRAEGVYGAGAGAVELLERSGRLWLEPARGGGRDELALVGGDTLVVDGPTGFGDTVVVGDGWIERDGARLTRVPDRGPPPPPPARWDELIGEYGWDHNTLYVLEKDGRLHALIEWFWLDPLEELGPDRFAFPDFGLYHGEELHFRRDASGAVTGVEAASVFFPRREVGTEEGVTFRIEPVRPVEELREAALAASPPRERGDFREPDLVEITDLDPTVRLDIRYATTNNFMGAVFYRQPRAFLQRPAAEALVRVHRALGERGYGLLIHDAYRPWYVTKMFWDATPEDMKIFVANPANGSRHNRGAAVDLTLYDLETGEPVPMVSGYDEFSERAFPDYPGETERKRWHRELLREAMEAEGFRVYEWEWWHFDYEDWREYPILNLTFEEIG